MSSSSVSFDAIGTRWEIETGAALDDQLAERIKERIDRFDRTYSRFRPDSLVSQVAAAPAGGVFAFPEDAVALFELYDRLFTATQGGVDPLVGRRLELLGYDASYSLISAEHEPDIDRPRWSSDVSREGRVVATRRPVVIDVGAAGKGYLVELVSAMLRDAGLPEFVIDASGDIRHAGANGIRIGLEHPLDPSQVVGVAHLANAALAASATTRRAWGDGLHHVLDARSGKPVSDVLATWVVADDAAVADGLATALFVSDPRRLAERFRFTYVRMLSDGRAEVSPDFVGEVFVRGD